MTSIYSTCPFRGALAIKERSRLPVYKLGVSLLHTSYRPDIDGLRAVAVMLVVACHAGFQTVAGGFVGVDIFFVISGFVVTNSITAALAENRFSFSDFYIRRAQRLIPALYFVMLVTFAFGLVFLMPEVAYGILKNIGSAALFSSNIHVANQTGYFSPEAEDMPLLHTWSLSVEEQFYFVLPLLFFLLRKQSSQRRLLVLGTVFLVSLMASEWAVSQNTQGAYYFFPYRVFEFVIGVVASMVMPRAFGPRRSDAMLVAGMAAMIASALAFDAATPFPGLWALLPCLGAAAVIMAGPTSVLGQTILGNRVLVAIGKISYSLYLWHWPVFFALRHFNFPSAWMAIAGMAISAGLSVFTYRYVEQPLRHMQLPKMRSALAFVAAPVALVACLFITAKSTENFIFLYPEKFQEEYKEMILASKNERPSFARVDLPLPAQHAFGSPSGKINAVTWGDSHALSFRYFFDQLGKEFDLTLHDMSLAGCPPVYFAEALAVSDAPNHAAADAARCKENNRIAMNYLLAHDEIKIVFMASRWELYGEPWIKYDSSRPYFSSEQVERALAATIERLQTSGKQVVIVDDVAELPEELKDCVLYRHTWFGTQRHCRFPASEAMAPYQRHIGPLMARITKQFPSVTVIHSYDVLCDQKWCRMDVEGRQVYEVDDTNHPALSAGPAFYEAYRRKHPGELDNFFGKRVLSDAPQGAEKGVPAS